MFDGLTAAHLHGLPVADLPAALVVRAARPGHTGQRRMTSSPSSAALRAWAAREGRRLGDVPAVAPRWNLPAPRAARPIPVEATLSDATTVGPVLVDPLPSVQLAVASGLPWRQSVPVLDGGQRREPAAAHRWALDADTVLTTAAARRRFHAAWGFADGLAESAGESRMRVLVHELGVAPAVLQHCHVDRAGQFIARTDFWWPGPGVAGEFDGMGKYDVDLHGDPASRRRALHREKTREVRLQRATRRVLHWTWDDLADPAGVARSLREAGVPWRGSPPT